jgi:hypothetical protein
MGISAEQPRYERPGRAFSVLTVLGAACVWGALRLIGSGYLLRLYDQGKFGLYALVGVTMIFAVGFVLGFWCILLTEILGFRPRKMYHYQGWPDGPTISVRFRR